MQKSETGLPIFKDEDLGDLVAYSEEMNKAITQFLKNNTHIHDNKEELDKIDRAYTNDERKNIDEAINKEHEKNDKQDEEILKNKKDIENLETKRSKYYSNAITKRIEKIKNAKIYSAGSNLYNQEIDGESSQETREGYNLFNANREYPFTHNGITFTKNKDGSITLNGTASATTNSTLDLGLPVEYQDYLNGKNLALKLVTTGTGEFNNFGLKCNGTDRFVLNSTGNLISTGIYEKKGIYTKKEIDVMNIEWSFRATAQTVYNNYTLYPCLVIGTDTKDYEPYGTMPSIDFPSEINVVGDNVNLFNYDTVSFPKNNTERTVIGNEKVFLRKSSYQGDIWAIFNNNSIDYRKVPAEYTMSFDIWADKETTINSNFYVNGSTVVKHNLTKITTQKQKLIATFFLQKKENTAIHIYPAFIENNKIYISNVKLEYGSKATGYTSYNCGGIDYKTIGKNLYNVKDTSSISLSTVDSEDWITATLDNTSGQNYLYSNYFTNPSKSLKPNTQYYIITEIKDIQGTLNVINVTDNSGDVSQFSNIIQYKYADIGANKIFINKATTKEDINTTTFLRTFASCSAGQSGSITFRISVIEDLGQEITEDNFKYEPYKEFNTTIELPEGIELYSLPDGTRDYIDSDGVIHKKINKIEVDSFSRVDFLGKRAVFRITPSNCIAGNNSNYTSLLCTHAIADITDQLQEEYKYKVSCRYATNSHSFYIYVPLTYFNSDTDTAVILQGMNEILKAEKEKGTPLTFYFLRNEEDTSQKLAESEIEKLQNLKTFLGQTNITITAPLSASYNEDINYTLKEKDTRIEKLESRIDELEKLIKTASTSSVLIDNLEGGV